MRLTGRLASFRCLSVAVCTSQSSVKHLYRPAFKRGVKNLKEAYRKDAQSQSGYFCFGPPLRSLSSIFTHCGTIYAVSSGHGKCGVAVIRVSGEKTAEAVQKLTNRKKLPEPRKAVLQTIVDYRTGEPLDRALVLWFPSPHSFTGDDICEFHVHGGSAVISSVFNTLASIDGLRLARPGDYTKRAFVNNKIDLTEVEGLGDLIHAETEEQRKLALGQMEGRLSNVIDSWSRELLQCLAHVEAYIDFAEDQHIEDGVLERVCKRLMLLCESMHAHLSDSRRGERLRSGVKLAIIGEPNVGKSSFLNLLSERPAAIVSPEAGTTRDVIQTALDIGGYPVVLSDTAGLRDADNVVEIEGVRRAKTTASEADLIIYVIDASQPHTENSISHFGGILKSLLADRHHADNADTCTVSEENIMVILNKCDLSSRESLAGLLNLLQQLPFRVLQVSCKTQKGLDNVVESLAAKVKNLCSGRNASKFSPSLTQARHRMHVSKCLEDAENAVAVMHDDVVIAAEYLRFSMNQLGKLSGKIGAEDILDVIFKDFCIGK